MLESDEQYLRRRLAELNAEYQALARPYIERLHRIYATKPLSHCVSVDDWRKENATGKEGND